MISKKTAVFMGGAILVSAVCTHLATAQTQNEWREAAGDTPQPKLLLSQNYRGTRPGEGNSLPRVAELKGKEGLWITWPGFMMMEDGSSRLFLQTTGPVKYRMKAQKKKIVLLFRKTNIHLSNNKNPLVTGHFNTPLARVNLKKRTRKTTELVLNLKVEATPSISQMTDGDGFSYLFIDFAAGDFPIASYSESRPAFSSSTSGNMTTDYAVPEEIQE